MKRRRTRRWFVAGAAGALLMPGELLAQSPDRPRRLMILFPAAPEGPGRRAIDEALRAHGWIEGRNLLLEARYPRGLDADLPKLAQEIVRAAPDAIMAMGPAAALAFKNTGTTIPVVFVVVFDPVRLGLAKSLGRPGGTFTGVSTAVPEGFFGKLIGLLREAVPRMKRIALLLNPRNPTHASNRDSMLKEVSAQGLEAIELQVAAREQLEPAFREAVRRGAGGMFVGSDLANRELIAELALRERLPTVFLLAAHAEAGGLMSYGPDFTELNRRGAYYVDRVLKGAKPADLPIEQPTKFELVINLKTAKVLGLTIPQSLLLRADRVIE